ncbi:FtsP/CotA-like multicopper oxidase with cupredoxin domain [Lysinibacillus composti]|uniref:Copper oxidase n=1 Tax=Lysinibacillus composti TaxID=720633 RepID=A0A3N9ULH3_9BACI|nr:copper oxidase [Lysinibacillus composti]MBM7607289.1 FtsP/CotA-like multicopper oxidase with cupredoxin domain [Lysinibacillus composti]RQW76138.1 copper oxidase [Lysinibacillus composti]
MVITPDIPTLNYTIKNGIKYFELVAEPVNQEILPGVFIKGWGYNGSIPGPTIQVYPGDYISIRVINHLSEATSIHWHGLNVPNVMDGVPDVEPSPKIEPGHYFDYHFKITNPPGTHMYHSHVNVAKQDMLGLLGGFVILDPHEKNVNKDYLLLMQEWSLKGLKKGEKVKPDQYDLNPFSMDFNMFTINGKSFPSTTPMPIEYGDIVRLRLGAIQIDHHPMHIHGHQFLVEKADGNPIVINNRILKNTILVAAGETWDVIFTANNPGTWPFHCHISHHISNNLTDGAGGMFTTLVYKM